MANQDHLAILKQGTAIWNTWREQHPDTWPTLSEANLSNADLSGADLSLANLSGANLSGADLSNANLMGAILSSATVRRANLSGADLRGANLSFAHLSDADLSDAHISDADLSRADLSNATFSRADLSFARLDEATLVRTNLTEATLTGCDIYGISAWDVELTKAKQNSLVITPTYQPAITVDNLKIAQFLYLLLNNQEIRDVITTITTKAILILGRFTPERKAILDAIRDELRTQDYVPILFDFDKPGSRDLTETITTLARLARFILADLTDATNIPQELALIVPALPSVPVQPLLLRSQSEYSMFEHFTRFPWVLPVHRYSDLADLLATLKEQVIDPAERKAQELTRLS